MKKWTNIFFGTTNWLHRDNQGHYNEGTNYKL